MLPSAQPVLNAQQRRLFRSIMEAAAHPSPNDFVEVRFAEPVFLTYLTIYETYNPGSVVRVLAYPSDLRRATRGHVHQLAVGWHVLWEGLPQHAHLPRDARAFSPALARPSFATHMLRIEFDSVGKEVVLGERDGRDGDKRDGMRERSDRERER